MTRRLTLPELLLRLANEVQEFGGQLKWSQAVGVHQGHLSETLSGQREPGPKILAALGYRKMVHYEPVDE